MCVRVYMCVCNVVFMRFYVNMFIIIFNLLIIKHLLCEHNCAFIVNIDFMFIFVCFFYINF